MLSREHAVSCSGAFAYLKEFYPHVTNESSDRGLCAIDQLLNENRRTAPPNFYIEINHAISLIYEKCLGYRRRDNGTWENTSNTRTQNENEMNASQSNGTRTIRPLAQSASHTARRRRIAIERNRPIGRPRLNRRSGIG
ncbi:hypothetical protein ROZALSC1DRAFT_26227 [Rozella allomycis CSF55]|uniref:Uncharacterized protein n=1 Tax=Rozella allomycis (strain CSF55) TaxID=988480 RepID=A0A4P9Y9U2_ROZAC|nr:hypothetical protein ROZALSC1DRAFT_26227 [Rozella allomycis CSF55]